MEMKSYKEDSTRGNAKINPQSYKRDVLVQVWLESRHLATLMNWLWKEGWFAKFRSEVVRIPLEQLVHHLVETGAAEMVEFADDAREMLEGRFGADSNPGGRGMKNVTHNFQLDDRRREGVFGFSASPAMPTVQTQQVVEDSEEDEPHMTEAEAAVAVKKFKENYEKKQKEKDMKTFEDQKKKILEECDVEMIDGKRVITPKGENRDIPDAEFVKKVEAEQEVRDKKLAEDKEEEKALRKKERRKETLARSIEKLQEEIEELGEDKVDDDAPRVRTYEEILADREKKDAKVLEDMEALDTEAPASEDIVDASLDLTT